MTSDLLVSNLVIWSLQIAALVAVAAFFLIAARRLSPEARLLFWQSVLLACLALPLLRPLQRTVAPVRLAPPVTVATVVPTQAHQTPFPPLSEIVLGALLLGAATRLALIGVGLTRLRGYRLSSKPLDPPSTWGVEAELRVSDDIPGPVTFGVRRPVVILPANFAAMDEPSRNAVLCHEILHVRRKDWLFTLAEEIVRAVFWFHPAIWWAIGEIQLAREQTVDRGVVDATKARDRYVDTLLAIAGVPDVMNMPPAPLFLRKRHLKRRIVSILKEVRMSRKKALSTLAAGLTLLGGSCWFITGALPLEGAPQMVADAPGVSVELSGTPLMHRSSIGYPREAMASGTGGTVVAQVKTDANGNVIDATILSGPDELRKSVLQSVLGWHFGHFPNDAPQNTRQVIVTFTPQKAQTVREAGAAAPGAISAPATARTVTPRVTPAQAARTDGAFPSTLLIGKIQVGGLSEDAAAQLIRSLPVHENDTVTFEQLSAVSSAVRAFDEHLIVSTSVSPSQKEVTLFITPGGIVPPPPSPLPAANAPATPAGPGQIRVGGQVESANLVSQAKPNYPALAKAARVQGTVSFEATISKEGSVQGLKLLSGPPLLVRAAMEAAQQWRYKPTLLNGQPVEVVTTIDIDFTLSE